MTDRLNVTVERGERGFVATSAAHPSLSGTGWTAGESLADLGRNIDRLAGARPESAETPCKSFVDKVHSSPPPAHLTRDGQEDEMSPSTPDQSPDEEWRPGKPVPGAMQWLKEHGDEYAGEWVAIGPRGLVAHGETFEEMERLLPSRRGVLIMQLV
jgi:hypothetical protein